MASKQPQKLRANLDVLAFTSVSNDLEWMHCQSCDGFLQLIQPDEMFPYRLLGLCEKCRQLFLILMEDGVNDATMILLDTSEWYRSIAKAQGIEKVKKGQPVLEE